MSKQFDLGSYLKKEEVEETVYKPLQYIVMPEPFQKATGLKGIPLGFSSMMYGLSDSGKTDILLKIAQEAVKQGILPKLIITENKLDESRLAEHGLIPKENCILEEGLTTLEDVFDDISVTVEDVKKGKLAMDVIILWDSVAGTPSKESFEIDKEGRITKKYGPQKNAQVIGYYNPIIAKRIASTREMLCDKSVGLVMLNQAYVKPAEFPGGMATTVPNGGEKIWFPLSLSIEIKEGQRIKMAVNGQNREIALVSKLKIKKNHITGLYTEGEILLGGTEMFENEKSVVETFKENYRKALKNNES